MKKKIINNFLDKDDLNLITNLKLKKIKKNKLKIYHNKISKEGNVKENECFSKSQVKKFQLKYHSRALKILRQLNPKKIDLYEFSEFHIIETGANYKFPIHNDTPDKLLSGVIYIRPNNNTGTIFYVNKKGDGKQEIKWKVNRAVFFSRIEEKSWHSYEGNGRSNRLVLVYNLMTSKIKKVYKIENNNYFLGKFRYWINPYLYRFLRITI